MSGCPFDPFKEKRESGPAWNTPLDGDDIPMILRFAELREAAKDWETYSSDAPFRVPIPAEEDVRSVRQLPIEADPPEHKEYRKLVEPFFKRPLQPEFKAKIEALIERLIWEAAEKGNFEAVEGFALELQSRALTYLLGVPESEADTLISWGVHVFREGDGAAKGAMLEAYINDWLARAEEQPGDDFYSQLNRAEYQGRLLTHEEKAGYANIMFAGGRDTVINSISSIVGYFAKHPDKLEWLRENPKAIITAGEEFVRWVSPVTHIGRVCPVDTEVHGVKVKAGDRVTLAWASANHDAKVFENPEELRLDRKPNPHVGYGFGIHNCLGAHHARLIIRTLLQKLCDHVDTISLDRFEENVEQEAEYSRSLAYRTLYVSFKLKH